MSQENDINAPDSEPSPKFKAAKEWKEVPPVPGHTGGDPQVEEKSAHHDPPEELYKGIWFYTSKRMFIRPDSEGFHIANEPSVNRYLREKLGIPRTRDIEDGPKLFPQDEAKEYIEYYKGVGWAGDLAGWPAGVRSMRDGKRILVLTSPKLIKPHKGSWDNIRTVIEDQFGETQAQVFYGWMRHAQGALLASRWVASQILVMAGPSKSGKSYVQNRIVTPMLGGRTADPIKHMRGETSFNADLTGAEHLMIEDQFEDYPDKQACARFQNAIKEYAVNESAKSEGKGVDAVNGLDPIQFVTISVNDEPQFLSILPKPSEAPSLIDKVILLKSSRFTWPEPMDTAEEKARFGEMIFDELPAFAYFLAHEFELPEEMKDQLIKRYGVISYWNPVLQAKLEDQSRTTIIANFILELKKPNTWVEWPFRGTSANLHDALRGECKGFSYSVQKLGNALGDIVNVQDHLGKDGVSPFPILVNKVNKHGGKHTWEITDNEASESEPDPF